MPLISVIIPAKNAEATIRQTIDSALNQTFSDIEIIIVDDDSSDSTLEIVSAIADSRIRVVSCNKGNAAASRNVGIAHAVGTWIAPLDSDDVWLPNKLVEQLQALQQHPQAAVAYSWVDRIDEAGKSIGAGGRCTQSGNVHADLLLSNILGNGSNPLICKDALDAIAGFDETLSHSEDRDLYLRLAERYEFVAVPTVHVLYRVTYQSKSFRSIFRSEASYLRLIERAYAQAPKSLQHLKAQSFANHYQYLIMKALKGSIGWQRYWIALQLWIHFCIKIPEPLNFLKLKISLILDILIQCLSELKSKTKLCLKLPIFNSKQPLKL